MTLTISQISNAALQKLAYLKDKNNDGVLQEKEFKNFKSEAANLKNISDEDFNQAMGLYITKPSTAGAAAQTTKSMSQAVTGTKSNSAQTMEISVEGDVPEELEECAKNLATSDCEISHTQTADGKTTYKVKFGDSWASLAEKFGLTQKFSSMKEAVRALKEMAGCGSKLAANTMPSEITIQE